VVEIDAKIARAKELIAKREELDAELQELLGGPVREKRIARCSVCGESGHRASMCPSKAADQTTQ
jgi:predicted nucleic acid-binding Zn ribbon protein